MGLQSNPQRNRDEAPEISGPQRKRARRLHLTFWERHFAADLEKGGHAADYVRGINGCWCRHADCDAARLQVWLYDRRPAA